MPASVLDAASAMRAALATFDPRLLSGADCARVADDLAATEKACAAARLLAAARAAESGAHKERGFSDAAAWLAQQLGTTAGRARQDLKTAERLEDCPDTREALLKGQISLAQAAEITEASADAPGAESDLLATARRSDLSKVREAARERRQAAVDPAELRRRQFALREFRHWRDSQGMVRFAGALPPETGLPFVGRVERAAQRLHKAAKRSGGQVERFDKYAADALALLILDVGTGDAGGGNAGGKQGAANVDLVVVCDINAYRRGYASGDEVCHIVGGGPIPVPVARELAKDAFLKGVLHDGVNVLTVKHFGRHYPAALLTALNLGPPPRFPGRRCTGCGTTFRLERDHDNPLANGGATEKSNIQDLCYVCHQEKTKADRRAGRLGANSSKRNGANCDPRHPPGPSPAGSASAQPPPTQPPLLDTS